MCNQVSDCYIHVPLGHGHQGQSCTTLGLCYPGSSGRHRDIQNLAITNTFEFAANATYNAIALGDPTLSSTLEESPLTPRILFIADTLILPPDG